MNSLYVLTNAYASSPLFIRAESGKQARQMAAEYMGIDLNPHGRYPRSWLDPKQTKMRRYDFIGTKAKVLDEL